MDKTHPASPWKFLSNEMLHENDWFSVHQNKVVRPSGEEGNYYYVHFKHIAAAAVPIDAEGCTYLVGQWRYPLGQYSWELPMGGSKPGEPVEESARRELQEETGLTAQRWTELMRIHTTNAIGDELGVVYVAEGLNQGPTNFDDSEQLEIRRLPLDEAVEMALAGEITDSISVAALLKVGLLRRK